MVQLGQLAEWLEQLLEQLVERLVERLKTDRGAGGCLAGPCVDLLVLQPTTFCNIDCAYCYLPTRHFKRRMGRQTLERVAATVARSPYVGERLTVVWHAGEPLVLPVAYYREAFAIFAGAARRNLQLTHSFQTNGILLDDDWVEFLAESGARIGVSIDGPERFHDAHRRTRSGRGTHARVLAGIERLRAAGIDFHVITVVTREALDAPDEFFDFYIKNGIRHVGFNVEEIEGPHERSSLEAPDARGAYVRFMRRIITRMKQGPPGTLSVRELTHAFAVIANGRMANRRNEQVEPLGIVSIDVEGNISTFSPELLGVQSSEYAGFAFGNVHHNDLEDVLAQPAFLRAFEAVAAGVRRCAESCRYFEFCRGGAPANKLFENGSFASTETLYCRLTKQALFDVVLGDLEHELGLGETAI